MAYLVSQNILLDAGLYFLFMLTVIRKSKSVFNFRDGCLMKASILGHCSGRITSPVLFCSKPILLHYVCLLEMSLKNIIILICPMAWFTIGSHMKLKQYNVNKKLQVWLSQMVFSKVPVIKNFNSLVTKVFKLIIFGALISAL